MGYIDQMINDQGETATLTVKSGGSVNKWGAEEGVEETDKDLDGLFQIMSKEDEEVEEGPFLPGELRVFLSPDTNNINEGNVITYKSKQYEIKEVMQEPPVNGENYIKVRAQAV